MAFHDPMLASPQGRTHAAPIVIRDRDTGFTALEWRVIRIAQSEPAEIVRPRRGLFGRAADWLRTAPPLRPLANERLEALRRLASDFWHGKDARQTGNLALFIAAGFAESHERLLREVVRGAEA